MSRHDRGSMTYHERAQVLDTNQEKGRFEEVEASAPALAVPRQPSHSPWARDPVPIEPFLDGRDLVDIRSEAEIKHSIARASLLQREAGQNTELISELQRGIDADMASLDRRRR